MLSAASLADGDRWRRPDHVIAGDLADERDQDNNDHEPGYEAAGAAVSTLSHRRAAACVPGPRRRGARGRIETAKSRE